MKLHVLAALAILGIPAGSAQAGALSLDDYLTQAKANHLGIKAGLESAQGGQLRSNEAELLLAPTVFAQIKLVSDAKIQPVSIIGYDNVLMNTYSLGVSKLTTFGLQAKLHYDLYTQSYTNPVAPQFGGFALPLNFGFANASPVLELTQSLWSNGFGKSTRATQEQLQAQALASAYSSSYQAKAFLSEAEINYWKLAVARQTVSVQKEALDRANKIYDWNARRARLHLGDASDLLQADALVKTRELDLLSAKNEERAASRSFNSSRNIDSDQVSEDLSQLDPDFIQTLQPPPKAALRDDVKAAQQSARASQASAEIFTQRDAPTLDVFASAALNGQQGYTVFSNLSQAIPASFSLNRPTFAVGLNFSAPIDLDVTRRSREGWRKESIAAETQYDRKVFEQEESWKNLSESLVEAKQRLALSRKIEQIQVDKLNTEKDRLKHGRTTTYQVLLFEQDYLQAQLMRVRNEASVLNLIAQMKLFGESL